MNKILLIDGNSLTYRGYYATAHSPAGILTSSNGTPVNAVLSMCNMLSSILFQEKPTHVLIAFDAGKKTRRHELLSDYKGGRSKTPEELITQFPIIKEMVELMGIKWYELSGWEADDIIATMATQASEAEFDVKILSSDKDLLQLVDKNTEVFFNNKGVKDLKKINESNFFELMGHNPDQVVDFKGIMGDPSDNLEGVKGIGKVGANKLIEKYGSLENIYENIEEITGATKDKLIASQKLAILCKQIATLNREVEVPFTLKETTYNFHITEELINFFKKYELNSLIKRFEKYKIKKGSVNKGLDKETKKYSSKTSYENIIF